MFGHCKEVIFPFLREDNYLLSTIPAGKGCNKTHEVFNNNHLLSGL